MEADQQAPRKRKKGLPANYGDATPKDVARALLLYRPKRKQDQQAAKRAEEAGTNDE